MFSKLFTIAIAIIFWPVTLLIFGWAMLHTLLSTKVNYTPPTDPETGKLLKSFYFGGEWEENNPPNHDELTTAWMFLLADCEGIDPKLAPEDTSELLERAINLLWQGERKDVEEDQPSRSDSCIPQLLWYLSQNDNAHWLFRELQNAKSKLPPSYDDHLRASYSFKPGIYEFLYDWRAHADQVEEKALSDIPEYTDDELVSLAQRFAEHVAQTDEELLFTCEILEHAEFHKRLSNFEWDGLTMTERGLAHWANKTGYPSDKIPSARDYEDHIDWEFCDAWKRYDEYDYGFKHSETTVLYKDKDVPVPVDIDDAPEYYIWTVSEGAMDYDIYEEKVQGKTSLILRKVTLTTGRLKASFDADGNSHFKVFMDALNVSIGKSDGSLLSAVTRS